MRPKRNHKKMPNDSGSWVFQKACLYILTDDKVSNALKRIITGVVAKYTV